MASTNFINECKNRANANRLGKVIVDVGERDSYNLLPNNATSQTINGITFTVNDDGTILVNGTNTSTNWTKLTILSDYSNIPINEGSYLLSCEGCGQQQGTNLIFGLYKKGDTRVTGYQVIDNDLYDINVTRSNVTICSCELAIATNCTVDNVVFKPMLRLASITDSTYEQYGKKYPITEEITNSDKLQSIDIDSGCYVDGNIIGSVYAKCLNANFVGNINDLAEKNIYAQIGVKYADLSTEYINMGKYTIERPNNEITAQYSQIKAYSKLYSNLDKPYVCNIDYSDGKKTLTDLYIDVCNQLGLTPKKSLPSKNIYDNEYINLQNLIYSNGTYKQINADTKTGLQWKLQAYNNGTYVNEITSITNSNIARLSMSFTKLNSFNRIVFGLNGSSRDTKFTIDVSSLENDKSYTISWNVLNNSQGSIAWNEMQIEEGTEATSYVPYIPEIDILNGNIPITDNPFTNNEKNRIVLQTVCKVSCSFADINDDTNEIELNWLSKNETPDYTFMKSDYVSVEGGEIICGPINTLIIKSSQVDDENLTKQDLESIAENGEHSITISDDYILYTDALREQAINNIWDRVNGLKYVDCKLTTYYGKPFLKLGNKIRIYTSDTDYFDTYVLKHKFTYDGAFTSIIESPALTKQEVKHKQDVSIAQSLAYAQININKQEGKIEEVVGEINNVSVKENNNYQEIMSKFDGYAPKESIVTIENSVKRITESTYTKVEIEKKLTDGSVTKVSSTSGTFDENGLTIEKTNAPTKGNFNNEGVKVMDTSSGEELLFAGFDNELNQTIVRSENMNVRKYLTIGKNSRIEDYNNNRTGIFYIGED